MTCETDPLISLIPDPYKPFRKHTNWLCATIYNLYLIIEYQTRITKSIPSITFIYKTITCGTIIINIYIWEPSKLCIYIYLYYLFISRTIYLYIYNLDRETNWSCSHNQTPSALAAGHGLEDLLAICVDPGSQNSIVTIPKPGEMAILNVDFRTLTQLTQFATLCLLVQLLVQSPCWSM